MLILNTSKMHVESSEIGLCFKGYFINAKTLGTNLKTCFIDVQR